MNISGVSDENPEFLKRIHGKRIIHSMNLKHRDESCSEDLDATIITLEDPNEYVVLVIINEKISGLRSVVAYLQEEFIDHYDNYLKDFLDMDLWIEAFRTQKTLNERNEKRL